MPSLVVPSRRSHSSLEDEDEEESEHSGEETPPVTPPTGSTPSKRARVTGNAPATPSNIDDSWALSTPGTVHQRRAAQTALRTSRAQMSHKDSAVSLVDRPRHPTREHQPGAIVRVSLKNFLAYSAASFELGPSLNMIIGPNGTGKSTFVCAICLGLGFGSGHLGRAKDYHEFVKHGHNEAEILIEIQGKPGHINPVIRRRIIKNGNVSKWTINGEASGQRAVQELAKQYHIQIDNLCQFLPQDRVVEFSNMTPTELLRQTQRAAAPPQMAEWHEELKRLRGEQRRAEVELTQKKDSLLNLEGRQNASRGDVERMRERTELAKTLELTKQMRATVEYNLAKAKYDDAKGRRNRLDEELSALEQETGPGLDQVKAKEDYHERVGKALGLKTRQYERLQQKLKEDWRSREKITESVESQKTKRENLKKSERTRSQNIAKAKQDKTHLENLLKNPEPDFDAAAYNERIRDKARQKRELETEVVESRSAISDLKQQIESKKSQVSGAEQQKMDLRSKAGQQEKKLGEKLSKDALTAWRWLKANRNQFEGEIFGPPAVECSVKDTRYADILESLVGKQAMCAFSCTSLADMKKLSDILREKYGLQDVRLRNVSRSLAQWQSPLPEREVQELGFEGWAISYIEGPETVLSMLCGESNLHQTAVSSSEVSNEQYSRIERSNLRRWATPKSQYNINKRSEYGEAGISTIVRPVDTAAIWTTQQVDTRREAELQDSIEGLTSEVQELEQQLRSKVTRQNEKNQRADVLEEERKEIQQEKDELQKLLSDYRALPNKIQEINAKLATYIKSQEEQEAELDEINSEELRLYLQRANATVAIQRLVEEIRKAHAELIKLALSKIEAKSDFEVLSERNQEIVKLLAQKKEEKQKLVAELRTLRTEGSRCQKAWQRQIDNDSAFSEFYSSLSEEKKQFFPDDLDAELTSLENRLGLLHEGNPGLVEQYERREREIESMKQALAQIEEGLGGLNGKIDEIRQEWEPQLDELVGQISTAYSENFEKIQCAGEVEVFKAGEGGKDFESWAIQVKVKFRESEQLSILDSHRQSGGERAVSTMFYMMALQSMSRAPFRLVDEINQGMDPRNERMVHERIVDIYDAGDEASEGETTAASQYFLVTPKLLSGLKYGPGMKVHCIVSGEHMPPNDGKLDFRELAQKALQLKLVEAPGGL